MGQLDTKIAWITGAGTGIGEAAALALADEGAIVVLTGRRKEPLQTLSRAALPNRGGEAMRRARRPHRRQSPSTPWCSGSSRSFPGSTSSSTMPA